MLDTVLAGPAPDYAADLVDVLDDHRPDTVVCSLFSVGAMVAAEAAGLPYIVLMANIYCLPARGLPPFGTGGKPAAGGVSRVRDRAISALVARQWNKGLDRINALRKTFGLGPLDDFWDQVRRADKILVLTSTAFDFPAELSDNVRYVGPVLDDPQWAVDVPWTPPPGDGPVVLVAMSTTPQDPVDCLQRAIDALASLPVRGIVTTGPAVDPKALRHSENVTVVTSAPHSVVLKHTSVVVTHGGHGTVIRALAAGVPLVVMPQGRDQADNATRVESRGAGVTVKSNASPTTIAAAVKRVLEESSFGDAAKRLGDAILVASRPTSTSSPSAAPNGCRGRRASWPTSRQRWRVDQAGGSVRRRVRRHGGARDDRAPPALLRHRFLRRPGPATVGLLISAFSVAQLPGGPALLRAVLRTATAGVPPLRPVVS